MSLVAVLVAAALAMPAMAMEDPKPGADKEPLICKREVPVGSLIASRKLCLTKTEWRKRADNGNATARGLVENGAGACGHDGGVCPMGQ
jgi:hypothetical protein